jgi:hypothetical protein
MPKNVVLLCCIEQKSQKCIFKSERESSFKNIRKKETYEKRGFFVNISSRDVENLPEVWLL